jgi:hypothetical protein
MLSTWSCEFERRIVQPPLFLLDVKLILPRSRYFVCNVASNMSRARGVQGITCTNRTGKRRCGTKCSRDIGGLLPSCTCRSSPEVPYTLSVKLSDFTVWRHTWRKNWVNCAVLTGNSSGLNCHFPVVFHTENCAVQPGNPTVFSVHSFTHHSHTHKKKHRTDPKKLTNLMGNLCCAKEHSLQLFVKVFYTVKRHGLT